MLPSASLAKGNFGMYEPVHGSAPDIAGQDLANPMADHLVGCHDAALYFRPWKRGGRHRSGCKKSSGRRLENAGYRQRRRRSDRHGKGWRSDRGRNLKKTGFPATDKKPQGIYLLIPHCPMDNCGIVHKYPGAFVI